MNLFKIFYFSFIFAVKCESFKIPAGTDETISKALRDVVDVLFVKNDIKFDIKVVQRKDEPLSSHLDDSLAAIQELDSYKLNFWQRDSYKKNSINSSVIFFVNSCQNYARAHEPDLMNPFPKDFKFLFVIEGCSLNFITDSIDTIIDYEKVSPVHGVIEIFEYLLIIEDEFIHLATIEWFTDAACNEPQVKVLNSFNRSSQKWNKQLENYEKFQNFYGCSIILGFMSPLVNTCWAKTHNDDFENFKVIGIIPEIFRITSHLFNFQPFTDTKAINQIDAFISIARFTEQSKWMHSTVTFADEKEVIVATPGELYTSYEKMTLPFDNATWKLLHITFIVTFIAIFVINRLPKFIQDGIFGENVQTPVLNVVSTFFGIAQNKLPINYISRFILIMFVFFCLIFRTCYQSKLFEFMTSAPRRQPPMSITDLKDRNYTVFSDAEEYFLDTLLKDEKLFWPDIHLIDANNHTDLLITQSQNASAKIALIVSKTMMNFFYSKFDDKWHELPHYVLQTFNYGFMIPKNVYLFEHINKIVQLSTSAGLLSHLMMKCANFKFLSIDDKKWSVMIFESLEFGFVIWIGCCIVCVCIFVAEILIFNVKKMINCTKVRNRERKSKKVKFSKVGPIYVSSTNISD